MERANLGQWELLARCSFGVRCMSVGMAVNYEAYDSSPPERFVVEVFSELEQESVQQRWRDVNVILRLSMLSSMQMQLDATLNLLCEFASEIAPYEKALVFFWDENEQHPQLCASRSTAEPALEGFARGNVLNFWA